jgi:hypothetical protein
VQCLFLPDRPNILCEASSGFYQSKPGEPRASWRVPPDRLAELAKFGFSTDDFRRQLPAHDRPFGRREFRRHNAPLVPKDDDSDKRRTPLG